MFILLIFCIELQLLQRNGVCVQIIFLLKNGLTVPAWNLFGVVLFQLFFALCQDHHLHMVKIPDIKRVETLIKRLFKRISAACKGLRALNKKSVLLKKERNFALFVE